MRLFTVFGKYGVQRGCQVRRGFDQGAVEVPDDRQGMCRSWVHFRYRSAAFHDAAFLALPVTVFFALALVVLTFAPGHADLDLCPAA